MFSKLLPKEKTFFELFNVQSSVIAKGLDLFEELLNDYGRQAELMPLIKTVEEEADEVAHRIFRLLNNTFVTPFDREDIQALVHRMDDVMDLTEKANSRMAIYALPVPPEGVDDMAAVLKSAFGLIAQAVAMLDDWKHKEAILKICIEVNSLENQGDVLLRKALQRLFQQQTEALYVIKAKEIYESLEDAIDRCEDLANIIETILIKNA
jgi:predicted phosphate transport protein (TIGR00153 family)